MRSEIWLSVTRSWLVLIKGFTHLSQLILYLTSTFTIFSVQMVTCPFVV